MKRIMKWLAGMVLAGMVSIPLLASSVQANQIELKVLDTRSGNPISGIEYSVYHVADRDQGTVKMTQAYRDVLSDPSIILDKETMAKAAKLLDEFATEKKIAGEYVKSSDDAGNILFPDLEDGIYLLKNTAISQELVDGHYTYTSEAFLTALPSIAENGQPVTAIKCQPKGYLDYEQPLTDLTVNKAWKDYNNTAELRPVSIEVTLYKDEARYDTVTLNDANNWTYGWTGLDGTAKWDLKEDTELENYASVVTREGTVFTVTNTLTTPTPPPQYYKSGNVTIKKKVTQAGNKKKVTESFFFRLFEDEQCSKAASDVLKLKLTEESDKSITFTNVSYGTYYVAETDQDGNAVGDDFAYKVVINQPKVEVGENTQQVEVEIENQAKEPEPGIPGRSSGGGGGGNGGGSGSNVKTGDETPVLEYLGMMAAAAFVIGLLVLARKRKQKVVK